MTTGEAAGHRAHVEPAGIDIEVRDGETLFDAAYREGYDWPTICVGQARCTHCHVRILEGDDQTVPVSAEAERRAVQRVQKSYGDDPWEVRLACQLELTGDVRVEQKTFRGERL